MKMKNLERTLEYVRVKTATWTEREVTSKYIKFVFKFLQLLLLLGEDRQL